MAQSESPLVPYDGSTGWEEYITHLDVTAKANGWTEERKAQKLACALRGPALSLLSSLSPDSRLQWESLTTALRYRFGQENLAIYWQTQLECRRQKTDESLSQLATDIERLTRLALPDWPDICKQQMGVRAFMRALSDDRVRLALAASNPTSVQNALSQAQLVTASHVESCSQSNGGVKMKMPPCACKDQDQYVSGLSIRGDALFVEANVAGVRCRFLIDTGATVSILHPQIAEQLNATVTSCSLPHLRSVQGSTVDVLGSVMIPVEIAEQKFSHSFLIARTLEEAILGIDFLQAVGASLDIGSRIMLINGESIMLSARYEFTQTLATIESDMSWVKNAVESTDLGSGSKESEEFASLLREFSTIFAAKGRPLGRTNVVTHSIDTGTSRPIKQPPRRVPYAQEEHVDQLIQEMLEQDVIEPSNSPWASPVVLIPKKDGSTRFCIDFRKINQVTKKDSYSLPCIQELLDALGGAKWFCSVDLKCGYWQIALKEEDKEKTAFSLYRKGLWQFKVMPFGLTNAPATFQRLMEAVVPPEIALTYLDDVIVYGPDFNHQTNDQTTSFK
ncbi:multicellular organismal development [Nesidiocoris tenuis]|uniref:Multicellular organismal development n=1 Tax=Nesidiocoris tenuis TaxID=355587 RepID=A0ABN7AW08_9HEMI|nr:multicellular organismal development [Nesidiocoris tenuis]